MPFRLRFRNDPHLQAPPPPRNPIFIGGGLPRGIVWLSQYTPLIKWWCEAVLVRRQCRSWGYPVWKWRGDLAKIGPDYGYFPNAKKTDLLVNVNYNDHMVAEATELLHSLYGGNSISGSSHWQGVASLFTGLDWTTGLHDRFATKNHFMSCNCQ